MITLSEPEPVTGPWVYTEAVYLFTLITTFIGHGNWPQKAFLEIKTHERNKCASLFSFEIQLNPAHFVCFCFLNPSHVACPRFLGLTFVVPGSGGTQNEQDLGSGETKKGQDLGSRDTQNELNLGSGDTENELDIKWKYDFIYSLIFLIIFKPPKSS